MLRGGRSGHDSGRRAAPGLRVAAVLRLLLALLPALATAAEAPPSAADSGTPAATVRERRYRMSAAIRPLLFWLGDKDVGGARIVWRREPEGRAGFEFLLGSDPDRAPRRLNRWGYVREEVGPAGATQLGLMRRTDEDTVEKAHAQAGLESEYVFKVIRSRVTRASARSENTVFRVADDLTFYDLAEVLRIVNEPPPAPPKVNEASLPPGTYPGFLVAVDDLVGQAVAAALGTPRVLMRGITARFNFNAIAYELRLRSTSWEPAREYGGREYQRLVRIDFESYNPQLRTTERFTLVCGTDGEFKGVPVYVKYQPKWWFRAEGVLDETQSFERPRLSVGERPAGR